ncbi:MAG: endonuclease/exonuclease/phosphatase family protein [Verrucomicrobia bacterium]|nr:endonuclease/exonuclease/phosphatase family protein [Verrucomicrobiota bacterium]
MFFSKVLRLGLGVGMAVATAGMAEAAAPLRVMSFNVRYGTAPDGENAWDRRRELFFETIERFQPDLIGFQEVVAFQYDAIAERMKTHGFSGVAREDGQRKGEFSSIGYRKDRFSVVAAGTFWLSETPEVVGSKSWDAALPRICSWVRLKEQATGGEFVFANTHFDHRGVVARREAARVLSERLGPLAAGVPAILTGDFNLTEDTPPYAVLVRPTRPEWIRWIDSYRVLYPERKPDEASFNGFKGTVQGARIDFVFHTKHFRATAAAIDRFARGGRYPSDHYPVTAVLERVR